MVTLTMKALMLLRPQLLAASILLLAALVGPARAQYVEDSVWVAGTAVGSLVYNSQADVVYGGSQAGGIFFAIDCATNTLVRSFPLPWPRYLAYDSIDNKTYVTFLHNDVDSVGVIDGTTHDRIGGLGLQGATYPVWDPQNNKLYVSCGDYDRVAVINCHNDSLERLIQVPGYPIGMELNPVHHKLYVRNWDGNSVSIIDLNTNQVSEPIGTDGTPECGHYSPMFDKYYVGGHGSDSLVIIDGMTDSVVARAPYGPGWAGCVTTVEPHGLVLVGKNNEWGFDPDTVCALDAVTGALFSRTAIPRGPYGTLYVTSSDRIYCACSVADSVVVLRGDGTGVARTLRVGDAPFVLAYSPVNRRVYVGHLNCAWVFVIRDTTTGVAEENRSGVPRMPGVTVLGGVMRVGRAARLVDVTGRTVVQLEAGENDVNGLARGAYFVVSGCEPVGKVLLVR
jgi:YVTN family beta-propeller protein